MNSQINVVKGDLFTAPKGSIILHACNCQGMWGSGIAKAFAEKFPEAYKHYREHCKTNTVEQLIGTCLLIEDEDYTIGCLFTSRDYGPRKDSVGQILEATSSAVKDLMYQRDPSKPLHLCKINAGLFEVPWSATLSILSAWKTRMTVYDF